MDDSLDQSDGLGGKHARARALAEKALAAQAAGDDDEADRLFAQAEKVDPEAVANVLQERANDPLPTARTGADAAPQNDEEIAAMTRTVQPHSAAPRRSGITGPGSGADSERS